MSSDKLGQSLDEILATQRAAGTGRGGRGGGRRGGRAPGGRNATAAPVGGVSKSKKPVKGAVKPAPAGPSGGNAPSRIVVSNLVCLSTHFTQGSPANDFYVSHMM